MEPVRRMYCQYTATIAGTKWVTRIVFLPAVSIFFRRTGFLFGNGSAADLSRAGIRTSRQDVERQEVQREYENRHLHGN